MKKKEKREIKRFDPVLKNVLSSTVKIILSLVGIKVQKISYLPVEINITKRFLLDSLFESTEHIYHIEIQKYPDKTLPERMFEYFFAIHFWQKKEIEKGRRKKCKGIRQIVIWVGKGNPPPSEYKKEFIPHRYKVIDLREIPPEKFLSSSDPHEVMLALIVGKEEERKRFLKDVAMRLRKISKSKEEFIRYIGEVDIIVKLFDFEFDLSKEVGKMGWLDVIEKTSFFKEGFKRGIEKGREEGIEKGREEGIKKGIEKGRKEGEIKGLRTAILLGVQIKFGRDKVRLIRNKVESIDDIRKLKFLNEKIVKAGRWADFYSLLIDKKNKNTGNSKHKNSKNK
jgi:predicted transposase YdaD